MRFLTALTVLLYASGAAAQTIPRTALQYQHALIGNARMVWGLNAPIAVFAAQLHQESSWNTNARSIYANGLAQFTPGTAADISKKYPELAGNTPFNPSWALRALVRYDQDLYNLEPNAATSCERWAFTLSAYNGGRGWVIRQKTATRTAKGDASRWFGQVEKYRVRSVSAHEENTTYPRVILLKRQPPYLAWGLGVDCGGIQ